MHDKLRSKPLFILFAGLYLLACLALAFSPLAILTKIFLAASGLLFLVGLRDYRLGFFLFLGLRPAIDFATDEKLLTLGRLNVNLLFVYGALMLLFGVIIIWSSWRHLSRSKLIVVWLAFLGWSAVSLFFSFDLMSSVKELARYLSIFLSLGLSVLLIRKSDDLTRLIKVIIISSLLPSFVALGQFLNGSGLYENGINRLYGTMAHPNMLAFYLILSVTLSVFLFLTIKKDRVEAYAYLAVAVFELFILVNTYTRGAYLAVIIVFFVIGILRFRQFLLASLLCLALVYLSSYTVQQRFDSIFRGDVTGSIGWRIELYKDSYGYFKKSPVIGQGVGLADATIAKNRDFRLGATQPHNDFIRVALEGGLIGLLLYCLLILRLFFELIRHYRSEKRPRLRLLNVFLFASAAALYAMSAGDNVLNDTSLQWQFWALIGGLLATQMIKKEPAE